MTNPSQSRASVSIGTSLPQARVLELASTAASKVRELSSSVKVDERSLHDLGLSVSDKFSHEEMMKVRVMAERSLGRTNARTMIASFRTKEGGLANLVPMQKRKLLAFDAYADYMDWFVSGVLAEDPQAIVTLVTGD